MAKPLLRLYDALIAKHLAGYRQMAFISGPRQVGKTTTARHLSGSYLDWDNPAHRKLIAAGPDAVATHVGLHNLAEQVPVIAIDELHKFGRWKNWLKGFFDIYADRCRVIVTGSSRLDVYRRGVGVPTRRKRPVWRQPPAQSSLSLWQWPEIQSLLRPRPIATTRRFGFRVDEGWARRQVVEHLEKDLRPSS